MSEKIGCLLLSDAIEIEEAARNYDDAVCKGTCPHHDTCRTMKEGGSNESRRDSHPTS